jgi:DNA-binding CsgD family transcriptional regulator
MMSMTTPTMSELSVNGSDGSVPGESFVGRSRERRLLNALAGSASSGGASGVVLGEPGIGKTALLRQVAQATPHRVRWVRGVESEAVLPFAAAADLLTPFRSWFDNIPEAQRQALEIVLTLADGPPPSPLAACAGALGVLAAAGDERPLVVLVDDLQWIDPESQQLMLFVARRLATEHVVILFAARDVPGAQYPIGDLPTIRLTGLDVGECELLARSRGLTVTRAALEAIVRATGGNPLAVLETITRAPSPAAGGEQMVTVGSSAQRAWQGVLRRLPEPTRRALFLVAISPSHGLTPLSAILGTMQLGLDDLEPAEEQGLVHVDGDQVRLRHPLLRRVLIDSTSLAVRLPAYRALADLAGPDLRAWYLSHATVGPDREVADRLVLAAEDTRRRSGYSAALRLSKRAAELTADHGERADRLLAAAADAQLAGDARSAAAWSQEALKLRADPRFIAAATLVRGRALTWVGDPGRGYEAVIRAAADTRVRQPALAAELFAEAIMPAVMIGDLVAARDAAVACEAECAAGVTPSFRMLVMVAEPYLLRGAILQAGSRLDAAEAMLGDVDRVVDQQALAYLAQGRSVSESFETARPLVNSAIDAARRRGAPAILALALAVRSELDHWTGRWSAAYADACESLQWAEELNQLNVIGFSLAMLARIEAARGDRDLCEARIDESRRTVGPHGIVWPQLLERANLGFAALTDAEPETAVEHLEAAWEFVRAHEVGNPNIARFVPDLIEAHLLCGHADRASDLLAWLEERARSTGLSYPAAAAARCRGLLAGDVGQAMAAFAAARREHARRPMPFELARTMLCEGVVLRRWRRPAAARSALREGLGLFERLGARPWAARAAAELAATGVRTVPSRSKAARIDALTPQELQIARMVADGMNNVEAAAAVFLSRKTVETHLTRVYRKLGIRSRTDLTRILIAEKVMDLWRSDALLAAVDGTDPGDEVAHRFGQRALGEARLAAQPVVLDGHRVGEPVGLGFPGVGDRLRAEQPGLPDQGLERFPVLG